jgi:hypothetical protein
MTKNPSLLVYFPSPWPDLTRSSNFSCHSCESWDPTFRRPVLVLQRAYGGHAVVIAHYKGWLIWVRLVFFAALFVGLPWLAIWAWHHPNHPPPYFAEKSQLVTACIIAPFALAQVIAVFRQVVWHGCRLIWIENGQLIYQYLGRSVTVPCSDVVRVSTWADGVFNQCDTITLHLHDGSDEVIRSDQFAEDADVIAQRLREVLGLKSNPAMMLA